MQTEQIAVLIRALHQEMKDLTIKAGVKEEKYFEVLKILETEPEEITDLHTWLSDIRFGVYDDVLKIWERHIPETWEMYIVMGVTNLREQILLRGAFSRLCKAWRDAPKIPKGKKSNGA